MSVNSVTELRILNFEEFIKKMYTKSNRDEISERNANC